MRGEENPYCRQRGGVHRQHEGSPGLASGRAAALKLAHSQGHY